MCGYKLGKTTGQFKLWKLRCVNLGYAKLRIGSVKAKLRFRKLSNSALTGKA